MADNPAIPLSVHRCRFVDYAPSAITALAFSPLPLPSVRHTKRAQSAQKSRVIGTLAVGHANGDIDICEWSGQSGVTQSPQAWVPRKTLSGPYPSKVDSIAFAIRHPHLIDSDDVPATSDLRLFSSGGGSELLEWDIERGTLLQTINSQGGTIWCMAVNPSSSLLALGCEDGTIRFLSLESDTLLHQRKSDRVKCRMLSIAWGPPRLKQPNQTTQNESDTSDDDEDEWSDTWLVTGGSDSSLRKWDVASGRVVDRMGTEKIKGERTLVWTVGVLGNDTIVSGDSLGIVKFWDARTCTQLQSFQSHGADVLCMAVGPDGKSVYTAGVDQRITQFVLVKTQSSGSTASTKWVQASSRRMHSHDIRALALWPPYLTLPPKHQRTFPIDVAPILASGGLDMHVVLTPAALSSSTVVKVQNPLATSTEATFEESYHRKLPFTTRPGCTAPVQISRAAGLISCLRESSVTVWRIKKTHSQEEPDSLTDVQEDEFGEEWEKVLEMDLKTHTNLIASTISDDGRWLVVSDFYETKLFALTTQEDGQITVQRIRDLTSVLHPHISSTIPSTGGSAFRFTPDSSKLVMATTTSSSILIIDLTSDNHTPKVLRKFTHHRSVKTGIRDRVVIGRRSTDGDDDVEMGDAASTPVPESEGDNDSEDIVPVVVDILRLAISPDGQWLATSDNLGRTHIYNLDSVQHHGTLPSFPQPAQALAFDPSHPGLLAMAFPDNTLHFYDVEKRQSPAWTRDLCSNLPKRLTHAHDTILGISFDPALSQPPSPTNQSYVLLWGSTWICKLSLTELTGNNSKKKRRRESTKEHRHFGYGDQTVDFKMITQYRPILAMEFVGARELAIVERPLIDVLATLPPAYFKHKYGAS
ncbi:WD40 repeat-like protein [Pluteus cervinus]|uniref:WD40 repeat-like protein n=1 Tax=Pluteus cervinus TaxID=181527 RepID=A0ACD3BGT3_9AGAR|nr:WD40 repeat-like protein [Pluteus cervinus]